MMPGSFAAKAPADGYTVLLGNIGTMATNPTLYPSFPVRPGRDLIPVTQVIDVPGALVSHPSLSSIVSLVQQGRLRLLGVVAPKRVRVAPDVPPLAESGYANLTGGAWQGMFVPAGTSAPVVQHIFTVTHKTLGDGEIAKRLAEGGVDVVTSASPREFSGLVERERRCGPK
jgi:tripartite-type tricarboxylate transporter receptor subunit TctC